MYAQKTRPYDSLRIARLHHRGRFPPSVSRNTTSPYNGLAARRALYEFAANDLPSSFRKMLASAKSSPWNSASVAVEILKPWLVTLRQKRADDLRNCLFHAKRRIRPPRFIATSFVVTLALSSR